MSHSLSRRRLLSAAGSAVFLQTYVKGLDAHAQGAVPKRILFVSTVWGTAPQHFASPGWTTSAFPLRDMLLPLAPYQSKMTIINNLDFSAAVGADLHGNGAVFAGTDFVVPAGSTKGKVALGPSVDQYLGARIGAGDPFPSVVLEDHGGSMCFDANGNRVAARGDATYTFQALFGAGTGGGGGGPTAPDPAIARKQRLLGHTKNEIRALQSRLVGAERVKLDAYLGGIDDLEKQLMPPAMGTLSCSKPQPPTLPPAPTGNTSVVDRQSYFIANAEGQLRVLAQAFACGLTRVGFMGLSSIPPGLNVADPQGKTFAYHSGAQHGGNQPMIQAQNTYWMEHIAKFWKLLESSPEAGGSVADSTLVVWMPGSGNHHGGSFNIPAIVLGNLKGAIQSGRHLRYAPDNDSKNKSPHSPNDFFTSLCNLMGAPTAKFGDPKYCKGPLPQFT